MRSLTSAATRLSLMTVAGAPLGQIEPKTQFLVWAWVASVRDGKVTSVRSFLDKERALKAAGLKK